MSIPSGMIHPDEARQIVLDSISQLPSESVPLTNAAGRVLARDVVARYDYPAFPASTMDGYAIASDDVSPWREITGVQIAGPDLGLTVYPGQTVKIMTGAPLPHGADAIIPIEMVEQADDHIVMPDEAVQPGAFLRQPGSDIRSGQTLITAGALITGVELGLIATMGYDTVSVSRKPRVAVISTGDELVDPGSDLAPGMIPDSNRYSLGAALRTMGAEIVHSSRVGDDVRELAERVTSVRDDIDILVTSGGVSVGDKDVVRMLLGESAEVKFRRVFMKPGKPLTFALDKGLVIFGLPGNPVSSMVSLELFVRPAINKMLGRHPLVPDRVSVTLATDIKPSDRLEFQRVQVTVDESGRLLASSTGNQISSRLASMLNANALIVIDAGTETIPAGTVVPAILLDLPRSAGTK